MGMILNSNSDKWLKFLLLLLLVLPLRAMDSEKIFEEKEYNEIIKPLHNFQQIKNWSDPQKTILKKYFDLIDDTELLKKICEAVNQWVASDFTPIAFLNITGKTIKKVLEKGQKEQIPYLELFELHGKNLKKIEPFDISNQTKVGDLADLCIKDPVFFETKFNAIGGLPTTLKELWDIITKSPS